LYDRRVAIINGSAQPTEEELKAGAEQALKDDEETEPLPDPTPDEPGSKEGIESFWLTALRNHSGISELVTERDEGALKFLLDVRYSHLEKPELGFKLFFEFAENPYFENKVLEKTYYYQVNKTVASHREDRVVLMPVQGELGYAGDFMFDRAKGTQIVWKEDNDLTKEIEIKKQRNKSASSSRSALIFSIDLHLALRLAPLRPRHLRYPISVMNLTIFVSRHKSYSPCAKSRPG